MSVHGDGDGIDDILDRDLAAETRPEPAPLYLIDASIYVFRAWHTMPDEFHDTDGWPTNAVQGFARFLLDVLERERPRHVVVAFDEALDSCFRNRLYPAYKANREPAPEELKRQFAHCRALCVALGLSVLGIGADETVAGFIHIGTAQMDAPERERPDPAAMLTDWMPG